MWRCLAQPLDRFAIQSACGSVRPSPDGQSRAAEAVALLESPEFFAPKVGPAELQMDREHRFQFPSPRPGHGPGNDLVPGQGVLAGAEWRTRPSVILLHGWNAELQYEWLLPRWSRTLARAGINAFRFELPYHGTRRPGANGGISNFLSGDLLHVMRATHQALADTRALALWLRAQGSPVIGLWGVSLGAWLAGLAAARQPEIDLAVLLTPVARMDRALRELAFCASIRGPLQGMEAPFRALNLAAHRPAGPAGNILVAAAQHDLFVPAETIHELEQAWRPEVWRLAHGHLSVLFSRSVTHRIAQWMALKARQGRQDPPHRRPT